MEKFSEKVYLRLEMPTEEAAVSDEKRIRLALEVLGYAPVQIPLETGHRPLDHQNPHRPANRRNRRRGVYL